jgi:GrpB-like predicted nucleotidyltransferase (UPF0157 family)
MSCDGGAVPTHPLWRPYAPSANADRQSNRVAHRQTQPGPLQERHATWAADYQAQRQLIEATISDQVLDVHHVGSTAIPGLVAKPVLDIDLTVPAVEDEAAYLPQLERVGFRLIFRDDLGGEPHRQLTFGIPNTNLHVWNPGAAEPQRHGLFTRWLCAHEADRRRYAAAKELAVRADGPTRYNDLKSAVIYDIYERAFLADPSFPHDPQPRG